MKRVIRNMLATGLAAMLAVCVASVSAAQQEAYRLGPDDVVELRAVTWSDQTVSYEPMAALAGQYAVSSDGTLSIPFAGTVTASGKSLDMVREEIAIALRSVNGLNQQPQVSLQIASYRPFYVAGDAQKPGAYPWRPGMTTSKALALAGGIFRGSEASNNERNEYRDVNSLRGVRVELVRLLARRARLEAEQANALTIRFPEGLRHPEGDDAIARIIADETTLFDIRKEAAARSVESNAALLELHKAELESLNEKLDGQRRQLAIMAEQVDKLRVLAERGQVVANRLIDAERTLTDLRAEELDLNTAAFRAKQRIGETERDLLEATDTREMQIVSQLQDTRRQIELESNREAMLLSLAMMGGAPSLDVRQLAVMRVRRAVPNGTEVLTVQLDDPILPGDVLELTFDLSVPGQ